MAKYKVKEFDEEAGWQGELTLHFLLGHHADKDGNIYAEHIEARVLVGGQEFDSSELNAYGQEQCESGAWDHMVEPVDAAAKKLAAAAKKAAE
jgi:hypothetical protein